ncbi:MAG: hypothetical protein KAR79_01275 [Simkaniaceae bacterium]|nr:hypothetical protein [Simkaniaceae bacterium]
MTYPIQTGAISSFPAEILQNILRDGDPCVTSLVSKAWNIQTQEVVKRELLRVFQYLNLGQPYPTALAAIKEIYRQTLNSVPQDIAPHLPRVSFERFIESEKAVKIRDTLAFSKRLPKGKDYVEKQNFDELPLEVIRERLSSWIEENPDLKALTSLDLSMLELRYLPPEIGLLTNLTKINLIIDQLTAFPPEIILLTNLTDLDLAVNPLTALPKAFEKSNLRLHLSKININRIRASVANKFFNLNPDQKNTVYKRIYELAIAAGINIESSDTQYGKEHVFDSEGRLVKAMEVGSICNLL